MKSTGVGEGGVLAFAFDGEGDGGFDVEFPRYDEEEEMEEVEMDMEGMEMEDLEEVSDDEVGGEEEEVVVKGTGRTARGVGKRASVKEDDDDL